MLSSAHVLAMDAKNLLDVVDSIRIKYPHVNSHILRGGNGSVTPASNSSKSGVCSMATSSESASSSAASSLEKQHSNGGGAAAIVFSAGGGGGAQRPF